MKKIIAVLLSIIMLLSCGAVGAYAVDNTDVEYAEGEILFGYEAPVRTDSYTESTVSFESQLEKLGVVSYENILGDFTSVTTNSVSSSYVEEKAVYLAKIKGDVKKACEKLAAVDGVTYAEPNYFMHTDAYTLPGEVTAPSNIYRNYQQTYLDSQMNAKSAWQTYGSTGEGVTVAVIDNGFSVTAKDFPTNLWKNPQGTVGWNAEDNNTNISPVLKPDGSPLGDSAHGSNIAGIIAMPANGYGGVGVAYNATLMLIKVGYYSSGNENVSITIASAVRAIEYAVANKADIISMSLGTASSSTPLANAVDSAYKAGIPFIASSGNAGASTAKKFNYPAAYEGKTIGVMATDVNGSGQLAAFSNYDPTGRYYDVTAPGVSIIGCSIESGDKYSIFSGSSQATALVSASVALYMSKYKSATRDEIYAAIKSTSAPVIKANPDVDKNDKTMYKEFDTLKFMNRFSVKLDDVVIKYKSSAKLTPQINSPAGMKYSVTYSSSNTNVATVDSNGNVKSGKTGSAVITCTVKDQNGNVTQDTCKVTVQYQGFQWFIVIVLFGWIWY